MRLIGGFKELTSDVSDGPSIATGMARQLGVNRRD
jgi:hypothetical protein